MTDEAKKYLSDIKNSLWNQFGASIDMLEQVISICPEEFLHTHKKFYYLTFHTLVFLDYYLTIPPKNFIPFLPFTITPPEEKPEDALDDVIPDRTFSKKELLNYVKYCREKCSSLISGWSDGTDLRFIEELEDDSMNYSLFEILLYNMRHVQHHTAQLNLLLRQELDQSAKWVFQAKG